MTSIVIVHGREVAEILNCKERKDREENFKTFGSSRLREKFLWENPEWTRGWRDQVWEQLDQKWDVLVIGG
jgi:hypothetical protein